MKKIVAFLGSPRKNGYSAQLVYRLLEGAKAAGVQVVVYDLNDEKVRGCQGCFYCRSHEECVQQDALQPMYQDIRESEAIVAAFPVYFGSISGQGKIWLDRMYPMFGDGFVPRCPGKKAVTVFAQTQTSPSMMQASMDMVHGLFKGYGWEVVKTFPIMGTVDSTKALDEALLCEAEETGRRLAL